MLRTTNTTLHRHSTLRCFWAPDHTSANAPLRPVWIECLHNCCSPAQCDRIRDLAEGDSWTCAA